MANKGLVIRRSDGSIVEGYVINKKKKPWTSNDWILLAMALLSVVFLAVFAYAPLYGLLLAFKKEMGWLNISWQIKYAPWADNNGFGNFIYFMKDPNFMNALTNTLGLNVLQLLINFPAPIIFAILLSELLSDRFKRFVQTVTFFPHFISWVVFGGIFLKLLDYNTGIVNTLLVNIGLVNEPVDILGGEEYFWPLIIITSIIKGLGWGSIIYVAAISGISKDLYEAAVVDGANRWQKIKYITLPSIAPTITLFFILSVCSILNNGIDHIWVFQNVNNINRSEVLDTWVYTYGLIHQKYSLATAVGLFKSIISVFLLLLGNGICKKVTGEGIY